MAIRLMLICVFASRVLATEDDRYYKTEITPGGQTSTKDPIGFTKPLDFSFSQQFFQQENHFPTKQNADFFGAESRNKQQLLGGGFMKSLAFPFGGNDAYTKNIFQAYPQKATKEYWPPQQPRGKSNYPSPVTGYKSDHFAPMAVYANSEDIEVFYPPDRAIMPQLNGRPRPYDGYRTARVEPLPDRHFPLQRPVYPQMRETPGFAAGNQLAIENIEADNSAKTQRKREPREFRRERPHRHRQNSYEDRRPQKFYNHPPAESRYEDDDEEEEESPRSSGYSYQLDDSITIPELVVKRYPYEKQIYNDDYTKEYDRYRQSHETDLEKKFGTPDYDVERYTNAATENLAKDGNCKKINSGEAKTCYVCRNPETGSTYEQCSYEEEPKNEKYVHSGQNYEKKRPKPVKYRYRRQVEGPYDFYIHDPHQSVEKKKKKKTSLKKYPKKARKHAEKLKESPFSMSLFDSPSSPYEGLSYDGSSHYEGPDGPYEGHSSPYEGPTSTYEGPSSTYEGPTSTYEGPSSTYEGPDHDEYYDRTDDRIPYRNNAPLHSIFDEEENKGRFRRGPKDEVEEFGATDEHLGEHSRHSYDDYRFGPEYFLEEPPRKLAEKIVVEEVEDPKPRKIFKNGDICERKRKKDMICMVCHNEKTNAKYQQCQYSKKPTSQGYSYGSEKSYSSKKPKNSRPQRQTDQEPEVSERKYVYTKVEKHVYDDDSEKEDKNAQHPEEPFLGLANEPMDEDIPALNSTDSDFFLYSNDTDDEKIRRSDDFPYAFDNNNEGSEDIKALEKLPHGTSYEVLGQTSGTSNSKLFPQTNETFEQYFSRVFPQFEVFGKLSTSVLGPVADLENLSELPGLSDKTQLVGMPVGVDQKNEVKKFSEALTKFTSRDWSHCVKSVRDRLICYECPTENGVLNEECMYAELPRPKMPMADILSAVQSAIETDKTTEAPLKGDFEGTRVEVPRERENNEDYGEDTEDGEPEVLEPQWESTKKFLGKVKNVDMSQVKIFFNTTNSQ